MKVWRGYYNDDDSGSGTVNVWASSKAKLFLSVRENPNLTDQQRKDVRESAKPLEIETNREGIVRFLNAHAETF